MVARQLSSFRSESNYRASIRDEWRAYSGIQLKRRETGLRKISATAARWALAAYLF